jgi:hypothetical protein
MGNGEGQDGQREMRRRKRDKDLVREKVGRLGGAHSQDVEMSKYKTGMARVEETSVSLQFRLTETRYSDERLLKFTHTICQTR